MADDQTTSMPDSSAQQSVPSGGGTDLISGVPVTAPEPTGTTPSWLEGVEGVTDKIRQFSSPGDLVKSYSEAQKLIGKKGLERPGADASDEDKAAWWKTIGRPDTPDDYKVEAPEGFDLDEDRMKAAQQHFHQAGLTAEQFSSLVAFDCQEQQKRIEVMQAEQEATKAATVEQLKQEFGIKTQDELQRMNNLVAKLGLSDSFKSSGLANDYKVVRAMIRFSHAMGEDGLVGDFSTPGGIDAQLKAIRETEAFNDGRHPQHKETIQQIVALMRQKHHVA